MAELAFRALIYLLPSELGGRKGPLRHGDYRPNWNLGRTWLGRPTVNDGRVLLDEEIFDPYVVDDRNPVEGSLSDDVLDVHRDVQAGLLLWDREVPKAAAVWEWRFRFRTHWGKHAVDALRALHHACLDQR